MNYWNVAVVACTGLRSEAKAVRRRLSKAWNSTPDAKFTLASVDCLDQAFVEQLDAVVIIADAGAKHTSIVRPLSRLDELHVPTMALLDESPRPGSVFETANVMIDARTTDGTILCARLHGMMHRQREVNMLRHDIVVGGLSHGGLGGEVARMHEELQLAAQAQRELLPRELPTINGISVAALWRPAQYVSGDIYDVIRLDNDHLGLFLADAVGHGVAAALMTMVISRSLVTRVAEGSSWQILDPSEVMSQLNQQMLGRHIHPSRFATAVYAVINCRSRRMVLSAAGHPPPFLVHADGRSDTLETSGGLLGVFDDEDYDQVEVDLETGDRLLMYTDGFEHAFPKEGLEGDPDEAHKRRLPTQVYREEFQRLYSAEGSDDVIEKIQRRLDVQSGSLHQADDLTLLCMHAGEATQAEPAPEKLAA